MHESTPLRDQSGLVAPKRSLADGQFVLALLVGCSLSLAISTLEGGSAWLNAGFMPLVSLVLWSPVIEEVAFRGVVQGYFSTTAFGMRRLAGLSAANILAAISFTAWHLVYRTDPMAWLVFFPALVFGYFRDRHGSLLPCVILHVAYNAALLPGWYLSS